MAQDKIAAKPILVVDDDGDIRLALEMLLQYEGYEVWTARDGREALARVEAEAKQGREVALVLSDLKMPGVDGLELLESLRALDSAPPVIMISGHGDVATAVEAMQRGAVNFLEKPLVDSRVLVTIQQALHTERITKENSGLRRQLESRWTLVGESAATRALRAQIEQVAPAAAAVLITGENGTGKEVVAQPAPRQPARRGPLHHGQLRSDPSGADRVRALRPREGQLHRCRDPPNRPLRGRERWHALPRRDRRHARGRASQGPARARDA